jgi:hypothetical protein
MSDSASAARIEFIVKILGKDAKEVAIAVVDADSDSFTFRARATQAEMDIRSRVNFISALCGLFNNRFELIQLILNAPDNNWNYYTLVYNYDSARLTELVKVPTLESLSHREEYDSPAMGSRFLATKDVSRDTCGCHPPNG